jgi:hypothetical protein
MASYLNNTHEPESKLTLRHRTRREIELRIHELERRLRPTIYDLAELARLKELLKSTGAAMPYDRALIAATMMAAFSGFVIGMAFYVLLEVMFS